MLLLVCMIQSLGIGGHVFSAHAPLLQKLAFKVLGQPSSSSCAERNWSTYSFIHSLKRIKLNPKRVEDLVYIHNNICVLLRCTSQYLHEEKTKMRDVGADEFGSIDEVDVLEVANLSLDESELEAFWFKAKKHIMRDKDVNIKKVL